MFGESDTSRPQRMIGKVMLIHDADSTRARFAAALKQAGIDALSRATTIGAQAQILRDRPDVVVIEAAMPLMSGVEFTRAIRAHPGLRSTVVLLSGPSAAGLAQTARECGADGTIVHSNLDDLVRTVQGWMARGRTSATAQHGYVLVACGEARGRELGRELQSHVAARVTDSGTEALRLLFARDAPASMLLGTALVDISSKKVFDSMLELDHRWTRRLILVREEDQVPAWGEHLTTIAPHADVQDVLTLLGRVRAMS